MTARVDLVADVGEGFGSYRMGADEEILPVLTSANVACGFHAGDPRTMDTTVATCVRLGVAIGAHPSFPDLAGFGRRTMDLTYDEIRTDILYQVGALDAFARTRGARLAHVAPHGRLGNLAVTENRYAIGVADAVVQFDPDLLVLTQPGELAREAGARGLRVGLLGLPDRAYEDDGNLVSRTEPGAVLHDPEQIAERAVMMAVDGAVVSRHGRRIEIACDSILLHGDTPGAVQTARAVRVALDRADVDVRALRGTVGSAPR